MRRFIGGALVLMAVAGFGAAAHAQRFTAYECEDGAQFQVAMLATEKKAYLQLDGKALQLPKKIAYTGDRYAKAAIRSGCAATAASRSSAPARPASASR